MSDLFPAIQPISALSNGTGYGAPGNSLFGGYNLNGSLVGDTPPIEQIAATSANGSTTRNKDLKIIYDKLAPVINRAQVLSKQITHDSGVLRYLSNAAGQLRALASRGGATTAADGLAEMFANLENATLADGTRLTSLVNITTVDSSGKTTVMSLTDYLDHLQNEAGAGSQKASGVGLTAADLTPIANALADISGADNPIMSQQQLAIKELASFFEELLNVASNVISTLNTSASTIISNIP